MAVRKGKPDPAPLVGAGLGGIAWDAYSASIADGRDSYKGPSWADLVEKDHRVAAAWCAAAQAVISATIGRTD